MPEKLLSHNAPQAVDKTVTHKFFLLFVFLLGYLILYPYTQGSVAGYVMFRVIAVAITMLSVYAVSFRRSLVIVALALAVPKVVEHLQLLRSIPERFGLRIYA